MRSNKEQFRDPDSLCDLYCATEKDIQHDMFFAILFFFLLFVNLLNVFNLELNAFCYLLTVFEGCVTFESNFNIISTLVPYSK